MSNYYLLNMRTTKMINRIFSHIAPLLVILTISGCNSEGAFEGTNSVPDVAPPTIKQLLSITVTPANSTISVGNDVQLVAHGRYSDGTTTEITSRVTWEPSNEDTAIISDSGFATGIAEGSMTVIATMGEIDSNIASITVNKATAICDASTSSSDLATLKILIAAGDIPAIEGFDTSCITDMSSLFKGSMLNPDLSGWDTSNVTTMSEMFRGANNFNGDISGWNTSNVTDMSYMFYYAIIFNSDLNWDTSSVTNMSWMFQHARAFNGNISGWDTSSVTDMSWMFIGAMVFNRDISGWITSNVTDMSYMFEGAFAFNSDISEWDTAKVTDMSNMFKSAYAFNSNISEWVTLNVTNMQYMFNVAKVFNQDISRWDTSKVTNMQYMFNLATDFNQNISGWNVSNVTNARAFTNNPMNTNPEFTEDKRPSFNPGVPSS